MHSCNNGNSTGSNGGSNGNSFSFGTASNSTGYALPGNSWLFASQPIQVLCNPL